MHTYTNSCGPHVHAHTHTNTTIWLAKYNLIVVVFDSEIIGNCTENIFVFVCVQKYYLKKKKLLA